MSVTVRRESSVRTDKRARLTAGQIAQWVKDVPADAQVSAINTDTGTQRDPYITTVGLRATWEESR
ncbi:hypothetical protein QE370_000431 [Aeromicrobium sp. SORGH_AS981]|uniref:hypothetical protein n=1 Tax=Aeromicrobium sp. SORGH_AS_0981 TaxID=3041802 RepID=UPI00285B13FE|nr:hypothetical protein [Aeromicrobium sp. SORGH_AS_0981]MDR6117247.1 hypothetical protein [Aeromicrobium sp. SORGH_AS_0981]